MVASEARAGRLVRARRIGLLAHEAISARLVQAPRRDLQLGCTEHHLAIAGLATECLCGAQELAADSLAAMRAPHRHAPQLGAVRALPLDAHHADHIVDHPEALALAREIIFLDPAELLADGALDVSLEFSAQPRRRQLPHEFAK